MWCGGRCWAWQFSRPDLSPGGALLVVTDAWTGARWGELAGLRCPNPHLFNGNTGYINIHPHRCPARKRAAVARPAQDCRVGAHHRLAPFIVRLLRAHLDTHRHVLDHRPERCGDFGRPLSAN